MFPQSSRVRVLTLTASEWGLTRQEHLCSGSELGWGPTRVGWALIARGWNVRRHTTGEGGLEVRSLPSRGQETG